MSNETDKGVDGFADVKDEGTRTENLPGSPDPGVSEDALEPLSPEERMRLEKETDKDIHEHGGMHEGAEGQKELEEKKGEE